MTELISRLVHFGWAPQKTCFLISSEVNGFWGKVSMFDDKMAVAGDKQLFPKWPTVYMYILCVLLQKLPLWSSRDFWQVKCRKPEGKCRSDLLRWCYSLLTMFWDLTCWYFLAFRIWEPALPGVFQECTEFIWIGSGRHHWTWLLNCFYTVVTYNAPFHVECQENSMLFIVFPRLGAGKMLS